MASTPENNLRLEMPDVGADDNTWGTLINTLIGYLELAITGVESIVVTGGTYELDITGGAADEARKAIINLTGTLTSNQIIQAPNEPKIYIIRNATSGAFTVSIKTPSGTGGQILAIPQGEIYLAWCDGADSFYTINGQVSGTVSEANNALNLNGVAAAAYAQLAVKQSWTRPQTMAVENVTLSAGEYTPNSATQSHIRVQQSEVVTDITINNPSGTPTDGQILIVEIEQHDTTVRSVDWGTKYVFEDGTDLNLTQTVDRVDKFSFQYSAGLDRWLSVGAAQNIPRA